MNSIFKKTKKEGLSLRLTFVVMLVLFLTMTAVLLTISFRTISSFHQLSLATDDYISLQEAATGLMSASDYLTEEAQAYTVIGDRTHLDNYLTEANQTRRRDKAIEVMESHLPDSPALERLKNAMVESVALMDTEYYAMRLTLDSQGDKDIPQALTGIKISAEDSALSVSEKKSLAEQMMHDDGYNQQKDKIRTAFNECIEELKSVMHQNQDSLEQQTHTNLIWMVILIIAETIGLVLMLWLTTRLGINPLLRAVEHIKHDRELPIVGANEFRYLAGTYNKMYAAYKRSIEHLSFKASHDELTGAFNRAGYDLIIKSVDLKSTAFLLIDADQFKYVNDHYGHETGDHVLKHITNTLKKRFRSDDYICRLGGDEFVVLMIHVNKNCKRMIKQKVEQINTDLANADNDLPKMSISVGVSLCNESNDVQEVYREADAALYKVKQNGRRGCCFYTSDIES